MSVAMMMLSASEAQRLTQRIKLTASGVRDGLFKLRNLVDEAKDSNVWQVLGFASWTAYLADTLGSEPMRLDRGERQELVAYLSGEGMSTRAIAPIVGVSREQVRIDVAGDKKLSPGRGPVDEPEVMADPVTGEVLDDKPIPTPSAKITGLDGKTYAKPEPSAPRRRSLTDQFFAAAYDMNAAVEKVHKLIGDDRFNVNKEKVAQKHLNDLIRSRDLLQQVIETINN